MSPRAQAILTLLILWLAGCAAGSPTWPRPTGEPEWDERTFGAAALLRGLMAGSGPPLERAAMEEELARWIGYERGSERLTQIERLRDEYVEWADEVTFARRPIPLSRELVARVQALGDMNTRGAGDVLLSLARQAPDDFSDYARAPGEEGPSPPRTIVRHLALARLARGGWATDSYLELLATARDDRVAWILESPRRLLPGSEAWEREIVAAAWLADLPGRLERDAPPEEARVSLEIAVQRVSLLGEIASTSPSLPAARALLADLLRRRGRTPLTERFPGARRDMLHAARRSTLQHEHGHVEDTRPVRLPSRAALDPWRSFLAPAVPRTGPGDEAHARLGASARADLARTRSARVRCRVYGQLLRWTHGPAARRAFVELASRVFDDGGRLRNDTESRCLVPLLVGWDAFPEADRAAFLARVLSAAATPLPFDNRGLVRNEYPRPVFATDQAHAGLLLLDAHAAWIAGYPALAAHAFTAMKLEVPDAIRAMHLGARIAVHGPGTLHEEGAPYEPIVLNLWRAILTLPESAAPTMAARRAVLQGWIEGLPKIVPLGDLGALHPNPAVASAYTDVVLRLYALAEHARRYGLLEPARQMFRWFRAEAAAAAVGGPTGYRALTLVRHADLAAALLEDDA